MIFLREVVGWEIEPFGQQFLPQIVAHLRRATHIFCVQATKLMFRWSNGWLCATWVPEWHKACYGWVVVSNQYAESLNDPEITRAEENGT